MGYIGSGSITTSHIDRMTDDGRIFVDGSNDPVWVVAFDRVTRERVVVPIVELIVEVS